MGPKHTLINTPDTTYHVYLPKASKHAPPESVAVRGEVTMDAAVAVVIFALQAVSTWCNCSDLYFMIIWFILIYKFWYISYRIFI